VAEKKPDLPVLRRHILHNHLPHIDIFVKIDNIAADEENAQVLMVQGHPGYQRILLVSQINLPVFTNPGKPVFHPDAEAAVFSLHMVFLADMREIEITDVIMLIETDEEFAVSNRYITRHMRIPPEE
jgi:hypothetical protein